MNLVTVCGTILCKLRYETPLAQIKEFKMKSTKHQAILSFITVFIFGCYNAPTPPSEIEGAHISGLHYEKFDCQTLNDEINFLEKREKDW